MFKKFGVLFLILSLFLISCGNNSASTNDAQVAELQKQIADLQEQVNQNQQQAADNNQQAVAASQNANQSNQVAQNNQFQNNQQNTQQTGSITIDDAKKIAASNAGFDVSAVTFIKTVQDYDDGFLKWEIDFVADNTKFEYDISATNGTILKAEREGVAYGGYVPPANAPSQNIGGNVGQNQQGNAQGIDVEQAKSIAVQNAGFNMSNVTFTKQKYDFDDGMAKWEIEFVVNTNKYEYDISAANGTILKSKIESIYND